MLEICHLVQQDFAVGKDVAQLAQHQVLGQGAQPPLQVAGVAADADDGRTQLMGDTIYLPALALLQRTRHIVDKALEDLHVVFVEVLALAV